MCCAFSAGFGLLEARSRFEVTPVLRHAGSVPLGVPPATVFEPSSVVPVVGAAYKAQETMGISKNHLSRSALCAGRCCWSVPLESIFIYARRNCTGNVYQVLLRESMIQLYSDFACPEAA